MGCPALGTRPTRPYPEYAPRLMGARSLESAQAQLVRDPRGY